MSCTNWCKITKKPSNICKSHVSHKMRTGYGHLGGTGDCSTVTPLLRAREDSPKTFNVQQGVLETCKMWRFSAWGTGGSEIAKNNGLRLGRGAGGVSTLAKNSMAFGQNQAPLSCLYFFSEIWGGVHFLHSTELKKGVFTGLAPPLLNRLQNTKFCETIFRHTDPGGLRGVAVVRSPPTPHIEKFQSFEKVL